jgi:hypothetical protein
MAVTTTSGVAPWNFAIKAGSDLTISMTWNNDAGQPMNLTGYSMILTIRSFVSSSVAILTLSSSASSGSRIVLGGTAGTIQLIFSHVDTVGLTPSGLPTSNTLGNGLPVSPLGVYDLQYTDNNGNIGYLLEGSVSLDPWVTQ